MAVMKKDAPTQKWVTYVGTAGDIRINLSGQSQYKRFIRNEPVQVAEERAFILAQRKGGDFVVSDNMPTHLVRKVPLTIRKQVVVPQAQQPQLSAATA